VKSFQKLRGIFYGTRCTYSRGIVLSFEEISAGPRDKAGRVGKQGNGDRVSGAASKRRYVLWHNKLWHATENLSDVKVVAISVIDVDKVDG